MADELEDSIRADLLKMRETAPVEDKVDEVVAADVDAGESAVAEKPVVEDKAAKPDKAAAKPEKVAEPSEDEKAVAKARDGETEEQRVARLEAEGRNAKGQFKEGVKRPKADAAAATKDDGKPLAPPTHWDAEAKAAFAAAPRAIQKQALKREEQIAAAQKDWGTKAEDYNAIDKVIAPHRNRWALQGMQPAAAINGLLAAEAALQKDPLGGTVFLLRTYASGKEIAIVKEIARQNGYVLTKATNQGGSDQGAQGAVNKDDPTARRIEQLEKTISDSQQQAKLRDEAAAKARHDNVVAQVRAFSAKPENMYFENVRPKVAAILSVGDNEGDQRPIEERLAEAYEQACWADPVVRDLVMKAKAGERAAAEAKVAADKAVAARRAAVSVTGAPGADGSAVKPGETATRNPNHRDDIEADIVKSRAQLARV